MDCMDCIVLNGPNKTELTKVDRMDRMGLNEPNWTELTEVDWMDLIELKWIEVDWIGPKLTKVD